MSFSGQKQLQVIGKVSWSELFRDWEAREARQAGWIKHYRERGYNSWREWRTAAFRNLRPAGRTWTVYRIDQPEKVIPHWYGGPFQGWRKFYYRRQTVTFRTIARRQLLEKNGKVRQILKHFPAETQLMGVIWKGRIVIIEGMHRCCAIALTAQQGRAIKGNVTIALTSLSGHVPNLSSGHKQRWHRPDKEREREV